MRLGATLLGALLGAAFLVSLGVWQLQRLEWKEGVLADMEARISGEPAALPADPDPARDAYLPVRLEGVVGARELHVLASTKQRGPVYRIVSPFETEDGRRVLLDRGTVPVAAKDAPRPAGEAEILGNLHWPAERDRWTPENDPAGNVWYARDVAPMAEALDAEPILVVASEATPSAGPTPLPVGTDHIPNDHLGYAITWFGLAAGWVAMAAAFLLRGGRAQREGVA